MTNYQRFIQTYQAISEALNLKKNTIKSKIGDSTNNNRTLTVRQLVRALVTSGDKTLMPFGKTIDTVYRRVRPTMKWARGFTGPGRTDAYDTTELERAILIELGTNKNFKNELGRLFH